MSVAAPVFWSALCKCIQGWNTVLNKNVLSYPLINQGTQTITNTQVLLCLC